MAYRIRLACSKAHLGQTGRCVHDRAREYDCRSCTRELHVRSMPYLERDESAVRERFSSPSKSKSGDIDDVKELIAIISLVLSHIYNLPLSTGSFQRLKSVLKTVIFIKGGNKRTC